jgi:hypothetical protein
MMLHLSHGFVRTHVGFTADYYTCSFGHEVSDRSREVLARAATDRFWPQQDVVRELFLVAKVDKKNISAGTVFCDLQEIYRSLEAALSG